MNISLNFSAEFACCYRVCPRHKILWSGSEKVRLFDLIKMSKIFAYLDTFLYIFQSIREIDRKQSIFELKKS